MPKRKSASAQITKGEMVRRLDLPGMNTHAKAGKLNKTGNVTAVQQKMNDPLSANMFMDMYGLGQQFYNQDINTSKEYREYLQALCRLYYDIHPTVGGCVDVFATLPIQGMDIKCSKDASYENFFKDVFLNQLDYDTKLREIGKEFFTIGECFTLSEWDDDLKIYVDEDVVHPSNFNVSRVPLTNEIIFELLPSDEMKRLVTTQQPKEAYELFKKSYGNIFNDITTGQNIPISSDRIDHLVRKSTASDLRGTPLLKRAIRWLQYEDRIDAAMKAVADRLYAPLTVFQIGMPDIGDGESWIPTPDKIEEFREELDSALVADFRAIITPYNITANEIVGGKNFNTFKSDRDMIDEKIYQSFGLSADIFKNDGTSTYASTAIRMELASQVLSTYQRDIINHYKRRAEVVARENEFYDYEIVGEKRKIIEDEMTIIGESGKPEVIKQPRLLVPQLTFRSVNFRDENAQKAYLLSLRDAGVPIPTSELLVNVDLAWDDLLERDKKEKIEKSLYEAKTIKAIAKACVDQNLPIPADIVAAMAASQLTDELKEMLEDKQDSLGTVIGDGNIPEPDVTDMAVDEVDATGGGARPNISDNKKKDAPKEK